jgi:hypothetical protein
MVWERRSWNSKTKKATAVQYNKRVLGAHFDY